MTADVVDQKPDFLLPIFLKEPVVERGPCPRNREIFELVRIHRATLRAVGEQFKLSPGRISQIVSNVQAWIARTGGGPTLTWSEKLRVSEFVHHERAEALFARLNAAFERGVEVRTHRVKVCDGKPDERLVTVKTTVCDPKAGLAAWKVERERHAMIAAWREREPQEMTDAERCREAEEILRNAAAVTDTAGAEAGEEVETAAWSAEEAADVALAESTPEETALTESETPHTQGPIAAEAVRIDDRLPQPAPEPAPAPVYSEQDLRIWHYACTMKPVERWSADGRLLFRVRPAPPPPPPESRYCLPTSAKRKKAPPVPPTGS